MEVIHPFVHQPRQIAPLPQLELLIDKAAAERSLSKNYRLVIIKLRSSSLKCNLLPAVRPILDLKIKRLHSNQRQHLTFGGVAWLRERHLSRLFSPSIL